MGGWVGTPESNTKCQDLPKFQLGGWYSGVRTENTQSAKICLNFNGGGGGYSGVRTANTQKCQDLPKFQFSGGGGTLEP